MNETKTVALENGALAQLKLVRVNGETVPSLLVAVLPTPARPAAVR